MALGVREHRQRLFVARARITHRVRQALHRLDVLREHLEAGVHHRLDSAQHAAEIRRERLDRGLRIQRLDFADARCIVRGAAVWALSRLLPRAAFATLDREHRCSEPDASVQEEWTAAQGASPFR